MNKHKLIGSILIAVLAMPYLLPLQAGLLLLFARHEMLEEMEAGNLQTISLSIHELPGASVSDELVIRGRYFDVEDHWQQGDTILLRGIFDERETALRNQLDQADPFKNFKADLARSVFAFAQQSFSTTHSLTTGRATEILLRPHGPATDTRLPISSPPAPQGPPPRQPIG